MRDSYIIVLITTASADEARQISKALVEQKKAACVSIIPKIDSYFWWQGKLDSAQENLLIAKTPASLLDDVIALVKKAHSYKVPEIIAIPIVGGNPEYLDWLGKNTE